MVQGSEPLTIVPPDPRPSSPQKRMSPRREARESSSPSKRTRSNETTAAAAVLPSPVPIQSNPKPVRRKGFTIRDFHLEAVIDQSHSQHKTRMAAPPLVSIPSQEPNVPVEEEPRESHRERHSDKKKKKHKQDAFVEEDFDFPGTSDLPGYQSVAYDKDILSRVLWSVR
jgi:hypothetical protein